MTSRLGVRRARAAFARESAVGAACVWLACATTACQRGGAGSGGAGGGGSSAAQPASSTTGHAVHDAAGPPSATTGDATAAHGGAMGHAGAPGTDASAGSTGGAATNGAAAAGTTYRGTLTGRSVDPPIRQFARTFATEAWTGNGTWELRVPSGPGAVEGTITLSGARYSLRGVRAGDHVRATIDQVVDPPATPDAGLAVDPFSGTLDGDVSAGALRGTWELSAQAGYVRRSGTFATAQ